jgi:hypothetical protein
VQAKPIPTPFTAPSAKGELGADEVKLVCQLVGEGRRRLATNNRGGLVDEAVILDGRHHEQGEVYAAREIAPEDGIAHMPAPHR